MNLKNEINIFNYFDYRKYLRDSYKYLHNFDERFSYRYIKQKTGIDPGFLVKVFKGQKNITEKMIPELATLLMLKKRQTKYFTNLVLYGRGKKKDDKKIYFEKLIEFKEVNTENIDVDFYEFYSKWYYTAIREILFYYLFKGDYEELAGMVIPKIKMSEAKRAINLLLKLKFIEKDVNGACRLKYRFISYGDIGRTYAIQTFQKDAIKLAHNAVENIPKDKRDISTLTMTLSKDGYNQVQEKLAECRREIMKIAHQGTPNGAYHVNFQLVPIGKPIYDVS